MNHSHTQHEDASCRCPHHKMNGIFIALAGLAFLLANLDVIPMQMANVIWPSLVILVGLTKAFGRKICKCCHK